MFFNIISKFINIRNFAYIKPKLAPIKRGCHKVKWLSKHNSSKKNPKKILKNYKLTINKAMIKRVRIVGPRHDRKFKFLSTNRRHFLRNKSRNNLKRLKRKKYIKRCDFRRVRRMIPLFKRQRFKFRH